MIQEIKYGLDEKGNIELPAGPPFDGESVLVRFASGWCEAYWHTGFKTSDDDWSGWCWVCMDDDFQKELDDAQRWTALPT